MYREIKRSRGVLSVSSGLPLQLCPHEGAKAEQSICPIPCGTASPPLLCLHRGHRLSVVAKEPSSTVLHTTQWLKTRPTIFLKLKHNMYRETKRSSGVFFVGSSLRLQLYLHRDAEAEQAICPGPCGTASPSPLVRLHRGTGLASWQIEPSSIVLHTTQCLMTGR